MHKDWGKFVAFGKNNVFWISVHMWAILCFLRQACLKDTKDTKVAIMFLCSFPPPPCFLILYPVMVLASLVLAVTQVIHWFFCASQSSLHKWVRTFSQDRQYLSLFSKGGQSPKENTTHEYKNCFSYHWSADVSETGCSFEVCTTTLQCVRMKREYIDALKRELHRS